MSKKTVLSIMNIQMFQLLRWILFFTGYNERVGYKKFTIRYAVILTYFLYAPYLIPVNISFRGNSSFLLCTLTLSFSNYRTVLLREEKLSLIFLRHFSAPQKNLSRPVRSFRIIFVASFD